MDIIGTECYMAFFFFNKKGKCVVLSNVFQDLMA